jgi:MYXO-CTERM domain-containing protein
VRHTRFLVLAVLAAAALTPAAQATMVGFAYSWQFGAGDSQFFVTDKGGLNPVGTAGPTSYTVTHSQGSAFLTLPAGAAALADLGPVDPGAPAVVPFAQFGATGVLGGFGPELAYFVAQVPVQLTLTDLPSGESAEIYAVAEFQGSLGDGVTSYAALLDLSAFSTTLGGRTYTLGPQGTDWVPFPGLDGGPVALGLELRVSGPGRAEESPEPSALALAAVSLGMLGLRRRRRRA